MAVCKPEIWLVRHADKDKINGGLTPRGLQRAHHLASLVADGTWPRFRQIFATDSRRPDHMVRERQTLEPIATLLGQTINETYGKNEEVALAMGARAVATDCGPVLIAWEHCRIPAIAIELGCGSFECHACWSDRNYGQLLVIDALSGALLDTRSEGFVGDDWESEVRDPSFGDDYECIDVKADAKCGTADGWHCPCRFPHGAWSGYPLAAVTSTRLVVISTTATDIATLAAFVIASAALLAAACRFFRAWLLITRVDTTPVSPKSVLHERLLNA